MREDIQMCRRRLGIWCLVTLVVASLGGCSAGTGSSSSSGTGPSASSASPAASAAPAANVTATIAIPGNPNGIILAHDSLWVASRHGNLVYRLDPASGQVIAKVGVGDEPSYLADDGHALWVTEFGAGALARIDPATNAVEQVPLPGAPAGPPVVGAGRVWQVVGGTIVAIDASSKKIVGTISVNAEAGFAVIGGFVWVGLPNGQGIQRFSATSLKAADQVAQTASVGSLVASDGTTLWAGGSTSIVNLDSKSGAVKATFELPSSMDPGMAVPSGGVLWLQQTYPDGFAELDPSAGVRPLQLLPDPITESLWFAAQGAGAVWVSDWDANALYEVSPVR
jgi:streptogramin lyase